MICPSRSTKPCPSLQAQARTPTPAHSLCRRCSLRCRHVRFAPTLHAVQDSADTKLEASRPQVQPLLLLLVPFASSVSVRSFGLLAQDELVLVEHSTAAGDVVQIVYRNGGLVDANALESLCDKVQQALICFIYGAVYLAIAHLEMYMQSCCK